MKFLKVLMILPFLFSCGQQAKRVKDLVIDTIAIDKDMHLLSTATLDLGGISLPNFREDIDHPQLGKVGVVSIHGDNQISFQINLSTLTPSLVDLDVKLPNGKKLPLIGSNPAIVFSVKGTSIKFYVSLAQGAAVAGFAIPFKDFGGQLGEEYGSFSIMPTFEVKGHKIAGGLFYSKTPGESGLGAFIDVTKLVGLGVGEVPTPIFIGDEYEVDLSGSEYEKSESKSSDKYLRELSDDERELEIM